MARGGIEPPTQGFSVLCFADLAIRLRGLQCIDRSRYLQAILGGATPVRSVLGEFGTPHPAVFRSVLGGIPPARPTNQVNGIECSSIHGNETRAIRLERSLKSAQLHQLVHFGNAIGLFKGKAALRGRPPKGVLYDWTQTSIVRHVGHKKGAGYTGPECHTSSIIKIGHIYVFTNLLREQVFRLPASG